MSAIDTMASLTRAGWSQSAIAAALGVSSSAVSMWRSGTQGPSAEHEEQLRQLAEVEPPGSGGARTREDIAALMRGRPETAPRWGTARST